MDSSVLLINWVSSANMFTFVSISGPFLFGKDMPTILGLRLMDVANSAACKMYSIGAIGHPRWIEKQWGCI
jgi:hypothetical protein